MTETGPPPPQADIPPAPPWTSSLPPFLNQLRRSTTDRKVAGVAGGLGRATGIDPLVYRIVLVVVSIFAGVGVLAYGIAWLLIAEDGEVESPGEKLAHGRRDGSVVAPVVVTLIGLPFAGGFASNGFSTGVVVLGTIAAITAFIVVRRPRPTPPGAAPWAPPRPAPSTYAAAAAATGAAAEATANAAAAAAASAAMSKASLSFTKTAPTTFAHTDYVAPAGPPSYIPSSAPSRPKKPHSHLPLLTLSAALVLSGALWAVPIDVSDQRHASVVLAAAVTVLGLGLIVGTLFGHTRRVIFLALPLTVALLVTSSDLNGGFGDRRWHPTSVQSATSGTYELYGGNAELDLRDLHPVAGESIVVRANVHAGRLAVTTPDHVTLELRTQHRVGDTSLPENVTLHNENGVRTFPGAADAGTLVLELHVTYGYLEVRRATP